MRQRVVAGLGSGRRLPYGLRALESSPIDCLAQVIFTRREIDAGRREPCMSEDALYLAELRPVLEHAPCQAVAQLVWGHRFELVGPCLELGNPLQGRFPDCLCL